MENDPDTEGCRYVAATLASVALQSATKTRRKKQVSRLSFPATDPLDPRRVSEAFLKGSLKGF